MKKFREEFIAFKNENNEWFTEQNEAKDLVEIKLAVQRPTHTQRQQADFEYNKQMNKLLKEGIMPRMKLEETIRANGIWNDDKEKEETKLAKAIFDANEKLKRGRIKLSEAAAIAKQSIKNRFEHLNLTMSKNNILNNSAESIAENYRFNYLINVSTVYNTDGKPFFRDYDDYCKQDNLENPVVGLAGNAYSKLMYDLSADYRKDWPEYQFLLKHGFVNDKLEFIDKEGRPVDIDGQPVPESVKTDESPGEPEFLPD